MFQIQITNHIKKLHRRVINMIYSVLSKALDLKSIKIPKCLRRLDTRLNATQAKQGFHQCKIIIINIINDVYYMSFILFHVQHITTETSNCISLTTKSMVLSMVAMVEDPKTIVAIRKSEVIL